MRDIKGKFSLRASVTSELFLQDVELPDENRLPGVQGLRGPLSCLNQARYGIAWGAIGAAMACYDEALQYTRERAVQGGLLAGKQLTQEKLVAMLTEITKAQLLVLRIGRLKDEGKLHHAMVSMAKRNNVDMALEIARAARDLLGANGIVDDYQAMRHMVNLETRPHLRGHPRHPHADPGRTHHRDARALTARDPHSELAKRAAKRSRAEAECKRRRRAQRANGERSGVARASPGPGPQSRVARAPPGPGPQG